MPNQFLSLELQGYKTFASKTEFRFPAHLTAIVGPNGSGKSNIADAVRWVLGEQAYSLLRGKKTVDMIFTGSEQRARASMASVSITFDNQNGWLPIDFSEVNLTRRAYRNGENEYLINNQRVRLKEINELLANSGLAERNYTIIGQGLVDSALSLKPEDRRRFFEEAAGIGLYRSRRAEANQKLEKTLRNVDRIKDILIELQPRIKSLEKQQEKAKTFQQIDADLKLLLKDWYGYYWHSTQKNLEAAVAFNAQQQIKLDESISKRQDLENQLQDSQISIQTNRERFSALQNQLAQLHSDKEENSREYAVLDERANAQKNRLQELEKTISETEKLESVIENDINEILSQNKVSQLEFKGIIESLKRAEEALNQRLQQRTELNAQIYADENEINQVSQEILRLRTLVEGLNKQIDLKVTELDAIKVISSKNQEQLDNSAISQKEIHEKVSKLQKTIESKGKEKELEQELVNNLIIEINKFEEKKNQNEHESLRLKSELELISETEQAMAGFTSGAKSIMDAAKRGKLPQKLSLLMEQIEVQEEYEVAIAAALDSVLEGIIVEDISDVDTVLRFIKKADTARTTLLLNKDIGNHEKEIKVKGNYRTAADVVSITGGADSIINNVFSKILITDNRSIAREVISECPQGYRVVTIDGEVFLSDMTIIAGKEPDIRTFSRKRKKREIESELANTNNTLQEIVLSIEQKESEKKDLLRIVEEINLTEDESKSEINRLTLDMHRLDIEQEQNKKQVTNDKERLEELEAGIRQERQDISDLESEITALEEDKSKKKKTAEKRYIELKELPVEELRATVTSLSSRFAVGEQMISANKKRLEEKDELLKSYQKTIESDNLRKEELKENLLEIKELMENSLEANRRNSEKIELLAAEAKPLEKVVENEITNQSEFLEKVDELRQKHAIAERHKMQAQLRVEKLRDKLDDYQKKIGEDFGILIEDDESAMYGPKPLPIDGIVLSFPKLRELPENLSDQISQKKSMLRRLGPINPNAQQEYLEVFERCKFLSDQLTDLENAEKDLRKIIGELDEMMEKEFMKTFHKVEVEFENIFAQLFNGGKAKLIIDDTGDILDAGIEIEATLPGRRKQQLALLSGGERSLTATALIFALLKISPTPFCVLDEVDAMLDESNVVRFGELLKELSETTQFIIITHNRNTVQLADIIYGVTMGKDSVSQVISLKLEELTDEMVH